jgi:hypothetical protein
MLTASVETSRACIVGFGAIDDYCENRQIGAAKFGPATYPLVPVISVSRPAVVPVVP